MNRLLIPIILGFVIELLPVSAYAGNGASGASTTGLLLIGLILLLVLVCFFTALKIFSFLKGGEMASAWQILAISFMILIAAEAVRLVEMLNIVNFGETPSMVLRLIGVGTIMVGIARIKKILS